MLKKILIKKYIYYVDVTLIIFIVILVYKTFVVKLIKASIFFYRKISQDTQEKLGNN